MMHPLLGILFTASSEAMLMLVWNAVAAGSFIVYNTICAILIFGVLMVRTTEGPQIYRKSVLHLLKYRFAVYLSSADLR